MPHPYTYLDKQELIKDIKYEIEQKHKEISKLNKELKQLSKELYDLQQKE